MKKCILFVDDEPRFLNGLKRILRDEQPDWDIHTAGGVDEALIRIRETSYDVVVSDFTMPGKDGFALLNQLQAANQTRDLPFIMVTGMENTDIKRRALELGAIDLLNKPVHPQDLLARLQSAIRLKEYQDLLHAQNATLERVVAQRTAELAQSRLDIIWKLAKAGEHRDEQTGNHVVRVGCYCRVLGEALGLLPGPAEELFLASPLHDIGKIGIPDHILRKRGPLTSEEWDIMRQHCEIGAKILGEDSKIMRAYLASYGPDQHALSTSDGNAILTLASSIALTHHEWWDGTGYPSGLRGERVPLTSRIVAVADVYDALRSERPYKPALGESQAVDIIRAERGTHLDPRVCDAFEDVLPALAAIHAEFVDQATEPAEAECAV